MPNPQPARALAAKLNPIISPVGSQDTLSNCAALVDTMGFLLSSSANVAPDDLSSFHRVTGAISAAIYFELEASHA